MATETQHEPRRMSDDVLALLFAPLDTDASALEQRDDDDAQEDIAVANAALREFDEALLLAETEELLDILEPTAFVDPGRSSDRSSLSGAQPPVSPGMAMIASSDSSVVDSDSSTPRQCAAAPRRSRNPSRERRQSELEALRKQVVVLEHVLHDAQQQRMTTAAAVSAPPLAPATRETLVVAPKWKRIAKRQRTHCEQAEAENKRLRQMLAAQTQVVANLHEALCAWQRTVHSDARGPVNARSLKPPMMLDPDDKVLLELLVSELDSALARVPAIFRAAGVDEQSAVPRAHTRVKTEASSSALRSFVEVVEVETSPFAFDVVNRVSRSCSERQSQSPDCIEYYGSWGDAGDTFAEKYRVTREHNGVAMELVMLTALKERVSDGRSVVVWRSVFTCAEHFPDLYVQEIGSRVSRACAATGDTVMACVVQFEPKLFAQPTLVVPADCDVLTSLVLTAYRDDMNELDELMDNMLLDESLSKRKTTAADARAP